MTTSITQASQKINHNGHSNGRSAFRGSRAHVYVQQMTIKEKPRYLIVNPDRYLAFIENGHRIPVLLETHPRGIKIIVDYKREQLFTTAALGQSDRILDYLGLADDDNRVFERMCEAFAQAHGVDPEFEAAAERKMADKQERRDHHDLTCERCGQNWRRCGCPTLREPVTVSEQLQQARESLGMALKPGGGGPLHTPFGASMNPAHGGQKAW